MDKILTLIKGWINISSPNNTKMGPRGKIGIKMIDVKIGSIIT